MTKTLVTYFSITGVTENVAARLAKAIGADLFEITPEPSEQGENARGEEQEGAVPSISFAHKNVEGYEKIFVGLPIWWYAAPTIIHTFLSDYDLSGKVVVPFVTSGEGGLDKVRPRLQESCIGADLKEATLLSDEMTEEELLAWAEAF